MYRIDHPTAAGVLPTPAALGTQGYFTSGNPVGGTPATVVDDDWMNMLQESLMRFLTEAGVSASKTAYTRLLEAQRILFGGGGGTPGAAAYTYLGDRLILQWGSIGSAADVGGSATLTLTGSFPIAFPTACYQIIGTIEDAGAGRCSIIGASGSTTTATIKVQEWAAEVQALSVRYIAIGK